MSTTPYVLDKTAAEQLLAQVDVPQARAAMFRELAAGHAVQPAQQLVEFPNGAGDFINYLGVLAGAGVYWVKTSPYIVREQGPLITAWTLLMSMQSGQPLLLCDAGSLTTARTAATTAVAVDALAAPQAHVHYAKQLRPWQSIRLYSPGLAGKTGAQLLKLQQLDPRIQLCASQADAIRDADVVMLCTSSAKPLLDPVELDKPALITSISTNAPRAHEVTPASLLNMDVYCDYRVTTPDSAGEMLLASRLGWSSADILGDLAGLVSGKAVRPDYRRSVFFRSIGLGLEDVALAHALYQLKQEAC